MGHGAWGMELGEREKEKGEWKLTISDFNHPTIQPF
jgi:hypothetical protein